MLNEIRHVECTVRAQQKSAMILVLSARYYNKAWIWSLGLDSPVATQRCCKCLSPVLPFLTLITLLFTR